MNNKKTQHMTTDPATFAARANSDVPCLSGELNGVQELSDTELEAVSGGYYVAPVQKIRVQYLVPPKELPATGRGIA
ncbi:bacteriocin [Scytonema sp. NUACC26]|uniref:bacteriocin n=1 Tax=Scytonema sp. NUACC26 TaxID=3140176 RepID=UPI0034DBD237